MDRRSFLSALYALPFTPLAAIASHTNPPGYFIEYKCPSTKRWVRYTGRWKRGGDEEWAIFLDPPPPNYWVGYRDETYFNAHPF